MKKAPLLLATIALACTTARTPAQTAVNVENPGFEEPYSAVPTPAPDKKAQITGAAANGWGDNSDWADITVEYAKDTENPHGGEASQKIDVTRVDGGAVQLTQKIDFRANHQYVFRVWMRGTSGATVSIQFRRAVDPYTTYAHTEVKLTDDWKEYTLSGGVADDTAGFLLLLVGQPATVWVDDVTLEDLTN